MSNVVSNVKTTKSQTSTAPRIEDDLPPEGCKIARQQAYCISDDKRHFFISPKDNAALRTCVTCGERRRIKDGWLQRFNFYSMKWEYYAPDVVDLLNIPA